MKLFYTFKVNKTALTDIMINILVCNEAILYSQSKETALTDIMVNIRVHDEAIFYSQNKGIAVMYVMSNIWDA